MTKTNKTDLWIRYGGRASLWAISIFGLIFLYVPIVVLIAYSFNNSRSNAVWRGFTLEWYRSLLIGGFDAGGESVTPDLIWSAFANSMIVGVISTILATILGTAIAIAIERYRFRGRSLLEALLFLPIVIPDITMGVSLLVFFSLIFEAIENLTGIYLVLGLPTIIIGHVAFNISFVAVTVRGRIAELDPALEEAALDLGANEWRTLRRITLPLIAPAILSGALLAFTLSLDDFVITFFTAGVGSTTLPLFVYGLVKKPVPPTINAISTLMLLVSLTLVLSSLAAQRRQSDSA
ncbi:ABC transporter permease [Lusitaniella coriacea LEGE 07157]|uniref:ABC transporter permease n=1 Tax=Lusitaniella coriacea LEGE 07157 TaxID=945747 RepID=A0A8J7E2D8_9CYAN|nr:ABC transporter permease [Lusitaniella coriacea]MBE9117554.1 ABC transporter permease [Lusitaniella coriacea LEGE 07157]